MTGGILAGITDGTLADVTYCILAGFTDGIPTRVTGGIFEWWHWGILAFVTYVL